MGWSCEHCGYDSNGAGTDCETCRGHICDECDDKPECPVLDGERVLPERHGGDDGK